MERNDLKLIRDFRLELQNSLKNGTCGKKQDVLPISQLMVSGAGASESISEKDRIIMTCELALQYNIIESDLADLLFSQVINDIEKYQKEHDPLFTYYLAECYHWGIGGVRKDKWISFQLVKTAAVLGEIRAQYCYAYLFRFLWENEAHADGEECKLAFDCLNKAAAKGYLPAQLELAGWFFNGDVVRFDIRAGIESLRKAAQHDIKSALNFVNDFIEGLEYEDIEEYFPERIRDFSGH